MMDLVRIPNGLQRRKIIYIKLNYILMSKFYVLNSVKKIKAFPDPLKKKNHDVWQKVAKEYDGLILPRYYDLTTITGKKENWDVMKDVVPYNWYFSFITDLE